MKRTLAGIAAIVALAGCSSTHEPAPSTTPSHSPTAAHHAIAQPPVTGMRVQDEPDWQVEMAAWDELPVIGRDTSLIVPYLPTDPDPAGPVTDLRVEVWDEIPVWDVALPEMGPDDRGHVAILEPWAVHDGEQRVGLVLPVLETAGHDDHWGLVPLPVRAGLSSEGVTGQAVGWIRLAHPDVVVVEDTHRVVVDIAAETVTVLDGDTVLHEAAVAVGMPGNATPVGRTGIVAAFEDPSATYADGPLLALARFSDDIDQFIPMGATSPVAPLIGFHTWQGTEPTGPTGPVSNGCVRVDPTTHAVLVDLPVGTPVLIG